MGRGQTYPEDDDWIDPGDDLEAHEWGAAAAGIRGPGHCGVLNLLAEASRPEISFYERLQRACILATLRNVIDARLYPAPAPRARTREVRRAERDLREDVAWIFADDEDHPFTFRRCCEAFGLNPVAVREVAMNATEADLARIKLCDPQEMQRPKATAKRRRRKSQRRGRVQHRGAA